MKPNYMNGDNVVNEDYNRGIYFATSICIAWIAFMVGAAILIRYG